jgi:hypothetical protein
VLRRFTYRVVNAAAPPKIKVKTGLSLQRRAIS